MPGGGRVGKKQPKFASISDARKTASQHEDNSEPDLTRWGCTLRVATGYPTDADFPDSLWKSHARR